jgi:hypothetical protein
MKLSFNRENKSSMTRDIEEKNCATTTEKNIMNNEIFHQTMHREKINTLQPKFDFPYLLPKLKE